MHQKEIAIAVQQLVNLTSLKFEFVQLLPNIVSTVLVNPLRDFEFTGDGAASKEKTENLQMLAIIEARRDTLEELSLIDAELYDNLYQQLATCKNLRTLHLNTVENLRVLSWLNNLTALTISYTTDFYPYGSIPANSLPNLRKLSVTACVEYDDPHYKENSDSTKPVVKKLIKACSNLTCLELHIDDGCIATSIFRTIAKKCIKLEKIKCHIFSTKLIPVDKYLSSLCKNLTQLKCLDLIGWSFNTSNLKIILNQNQQIKILHDNDRIYIAAKQPTKTVTSFLDCWQLADIGGICGRMKQWCLEPCKNISDIKK
jgi:hypothetical protein